METGRRGCALMRCAHVVSISALLAALATPALAQQASSPAEAAGNIQTFDPAYFATYNPVTAADMVARVPGFEVRDGDDRRGFAATAGNILVNGERPSSKVMVSEQLKRIPAEMVMRVELISGGAGSEVSGQSLLVNVVLRAATTTRSPVTYVAALRHIQYSGRIGYTLQASTSMRLGPTAELALDFQAPNLLGRGESFDILRNAQDVTTGTRIVNGQPMNRGLQAAAVLKWKPGPNDAVNLNAQVGPTWNQTENYSLQRTVTGAVANETRGLSDFDNNYTGELGGDWEHRFSPVFSTKLIGLATITNVDQLDIFDTYSAPATYFTRTQSRATEGGERVGRLVATWRAHPSHTIEFGGEGAYNFRDTDLDIFTQAPGGPKVAETLAVSKALVEELRGEAFISDVWAVNDILTLEGAFTFEASRITQTGDKQQEREFTYPKPRVTATFAFNPSSQLRASLVRDVAQLDFAEFSSTVDFINASQTQGNPDLVPQQAWKARAEWQRRFGARGALNLAVFYDAVEDVHDFIEITSIDDLGKIVRYDAYGNIGDGTRKGVEMRATLPLAFIGLQRAELRFNGLLQETEVTDPKTGQKRSFSVSPERQGSPSGSATLNAGDKDWAYVINFRQELPSLKSAWGSAIVQWAGRSEYKRAEVISYERSEPRVDLYFETTALQPVTLRFNVNNIFSSSDERIRTFYQGDRSSGIISRSELRDAKGGPEGTRSFGMQVSGKF